MGDPLVDALKSIADGSMQADRALLGLVNVLIDRFKEFDQRADLLDEIQKQLLDRFEELEQRIRLLEKQPLDAVGKTMPART